MSRKSSLCCAPRIWCSTMMVGVLLHLIVLSAEGAYSNASDAQWHARRRLASGDANANLNLRGGAPEQLSSDVGSCFVALGKKLNQTQAMTITAWVWLAGGGGGAEGRPLQKARGILANKVSGCQSQSFGFALYVAGPEDNGGADYGKLVLERGRGQGRIGCARLATASPLPAEQWVHVGVRFADGLAALFVHGGKVAEEEVGVTGGHTTDLHIGSFPFGELPFNGKIRDAAVFSGALADETLASLASARLGQVSRALATAKSAQVPMVAALPLDDACWGGGDGDTVRDLKLSPEGDESPSRSYSAMHQSLSAFLANQEGTLRTDADVSEEAAKTGGFATGVPAQEVTQNLLAESDRMGAIRAQAVKESMLHAWRGYQAFAWGQDELLPVSMQGVEAWGSIACTMIDSLSTLWLMGLKSQFWEARDWVRDNLTFDNVGRVSVFETNIRVLGGLLSAFDLSGDRAFLDAARQLGDRLMPAFATPLGIPFTNIDLSEGYQQQRTYHYATNMAEIGTLQVEFRYLSRATGNATYGETAERIVKFLATKKPPNGIYFTNLDLTTGGFHDTLEKMGASSDSFYEYLLKVWLQGGRTEPMYREMYDRAMDGVAADLVKGTPKGTAILGFRSGGQWTSIQEHLACFLGGTLALGSITGPAGTQEEERRNKRDLQLAQALGYSCRQMYALQPTGLAPDTVHVHGEGMPAVDPGGAASYILRPETVETLFVLHEVTKNPVYREWGWQIFLAIEQHCKTEIAYGEYSNAEVVGREPQDHMQSFFLAETLKYLYLLLLPNQPVDLQKVVFNTEAHPLQIFSEMEKTRAQAA